MKFSCDQCHAQYMIADEKVGERGVKVKCKKCQHVIVVKPAMAAAPAADSAPFTFREDEKTTVGPAPTMPPADTQMGGTFDALFGNKPGAGGWGDATQMMPQQQLGQLRQESFDIGGGGGGMSMDAGMGAFPSSAPAA